MPVPESAPPVPAPDPPTRWTRTHAARTEPATAEREAAPFGPVVMLTPLDAEGRAVLPGHITRAWRRRDGQVEARSLWSVEGPALIARCRVRMVQTGEVWAEPLDHGIADVAAGVRTAVAVRVWWRP